MSTTNRALDRGPDGKLLRTLRRSHEVPFPHGTPRSWRKLYMTRPRRRENKRLCWQVQRGADYEGMSFPLGNRKPHIYYW